MRLGPQVQKFCKEASKFTHYLWPILSPLLLNFTILLTIHPNSMPPQDNLFSNFLTKIEAIREAPLKFSSTLLHYSIIYNSAQPYPLYHVLQPGIALYTVLWYS